MTECTGKRYWWRRRNAAITRYVEWARGVPHPLPGSPAGKLYDKWVKARIQALKVRG